MNDESKSILKWLRYHPGICLEGPNKTKERHEKGVRIAGLSRDSNLASPKDKSKSITANQCDQWYFHISVICS